MFGCSFGVVGDAHAAAGADRDAAGYRLFLKDQDPRAVIVSFNRRNGAGKPKSDHDDVKCFRHLKSLPGLQQGWKKNVRWVFKQMVQRSPIFLC